MIRRFLWESCRVLYLYIAKPLVFLIPPDKVHTGMIGIFSVVGRVAILRGFVALIFKRGLDERLKQTYHGVEFNNPVGLAAGFDKNGEIVPIVSALGFGFGTVGSMTAKYCVGNPRPWFYRLPKTNSIVVNAGLANDGSLSIIKRLHQYKPNTIKNFPVVLSVAKTNVRSVVTIQEGVDDYIATLKRVKHDKVIKMIELNISCPNTYGGEPFTTPRELNHLLTAVDKVDVSQPIFVKMPIDKSWSDFKKLLDVIVKHRVAGVTISNLMKDRSKVELKDDLPDSVKGNLSGKPTWVHGNELISKTYAIYGKKLTIIGLGGVFSADDAYEKIKLGASLVEFNTGLIFRGPQLAAEIYDGLIRLMKKDGFTNISQVVGLDANS